MSSWIHVSELLPEIDGLTSDFVLAYDKNRGYLIAYLCDLKDEIYWEIKDNMTMNRSQLNITHWQPLPITPLQEEIEFKIKTSLFERFLRKLHIIR
jgi:hypothetical protein